jgi:hypothetical protein
MADEGDYRDWLEKGLNKPGNDVAKVARALGKHHSVVYKLLDGNRKFHIDELPKIASAIDEPIPVHAETILPVRPRKYVTMKLSGVISAGTFAVPKSAGSADPVVMFRDKQFPKANHMAFGVTGKQLEDQKIFEGDRLHCIDFEAEGVFQNLPDRALIVVERTRNGTRERAIKIAVKSEKDLAGQEKRAINIAKVHRDSGDGIAVRTTGTLRILSVVRMVSRPLA